MLDAWGEQVPTVVHVTVNWVVHTRFRWELRQRGEVMFWVPAPPRSGPGGAVPAYQGRGRRSKAPCNRCVRAPIAASRGTRLTVRDGEKGPVEMERSAPRADAAQRSERPRKWLVAPVFPSQTHVE